MEAFIVNLYKELESELQTVSPDCNAVRGYNVKAEMVERSIRNLKKHLNEHPFQSRESEVAYFKHSAPQFFKLQILYTLHYNLERTRITSPDKDTFFKYVKKKLHRIQKFLRRHDKLRIYYHLGETAKDHDFFVNAVPSKTKEFLTADGYYCKKSVTLAKILAYEEFLPALLLEDAIAKGVSESLEPNVLSPKRKYTWNLSHAATAELFYPWVDLKCIKVDGRCADLKDMVEMWREVFGYSIPNISDVQLHNKRRKKDKAPFLNAMLGAYLKPLIKNK
jgi:hypothetical protein